METLKLPLLKILTHMHTFGYLVILYPLYTQFAKVSLLLFLIYKNRLINTPTTIIYENTFPIFTKMLLILYYFLYKKLSVMEISKLPLNFFTPMHTFWLFDHFASNYYPIYQNVLNIFLNIQKCHL